METSEAGGSPPDDGGLWMKLDSSPVTAHTRIQSVTSDEEPQEELSSYDSNPPPRPLPPTEGSTEPGTNNSSVILSNKAADATEAEANPSSLDWHHGEKQLMATREEEGTVNTGHTSVNIDCLSRNKSYNRVQSANNQDTTSVEATAGLMETCSDQNKSEKAENTGSQQQTRTTVHEPEDTSGSTVTDPKVTAANPDCDDVNDEDSSELHTCNQMGRATEQAQTPDVTHDDNGPVDTRPLNYDLTKDEWARRESGSGEVQLPTAEGNMKSEQRHRTRKIATDIQHGEQLLQRLQLVQWRQDGSTLTFQQTGLGTEEETSTWSTEPQNEGDRADPTEPDNEREGTEPRTSDDQGAEVGSLDPGEDRIGAPPDGETSKETQEAAHRKQSLQRAGGVFNLPHNPDVLEIPFHTSITLEPFQSQRSTWQFSEQKMQKEISVDSQREVVLVNQGKIPGGYSKGEVRRLKETRLLFEAFQQVQAEGPTRHRTSPTFPTKGHVSVLERTRSLEMFSLKSCPVTRAHSLRLYKSGTSEREGSPENTRSKSPTARLCPYPTRDKHLHTYRRVDSLSPDTSAPAVETRSKARHEPPLLQQNPFFKLRPALALQPELEKDIREAREREEELRRQRGALYGDKAEDQERSQVTETREPGLGQQTTGKLERVWPPPSKQTQQEPRAHRAGGPRAPLWQRWESGAINGRQPQDE